MKEHDNEIELTKTEADALRFVIKESPLPIMSLVPLQLEFTEHEADQLKIILQSYIIDWQKKANAATDISDITISRIYSHRIQIAEKFAIQLTQIIKHVKLATALIKTEPFPDSYQISEEEIIETAGIRKLENGSFVSEFTKSPGVSIRE